jgi:parallel beta-helix repeat protein
MNKYFVAGVFLFLGFTASATTYYVNVANTVGQAAPYSTPATASTTIQAAVNQADYGDTVQVADGYYVLSSEILVTNHMHIVSERGANSTVIDGGDNSRCFNIDIYIDPWIGGEEGELRGFFITNGSGTYGGGVRCGTDTVIADCTFDNNYADDGGGLYGGKAYNCVFTNNIANYEGGGMNGDGSHTAYNCTFVDNFADWNGGGLYGGDADDCIFIENAAQVGAGMCSDGSASRCSFINNIAEYYGGALFGIDTSLGHRSAYSCVASNNTALVSGGGFENVYAYNSLIVSNTAPKGGGAYKSSLKNCTITENSATYGGGVNDCSLQNSIIWYNGCTISGSDFEDCSSITYCCSLLLTHNVDGNITTAPLFINPAAGNYRLASNSTCINAGTNNISILTDLDGNLRRQGIRVDMGAYEASLPENPVYVSVSTGNDENDGQSWSTAKQTIQAAIDIATDTVRVSNGVYLVTSEISSPGAVYIVSANGPEYTTVDGGGVTRCFNLSAFSKLSGFTVTGGTTPVDESGGGIYCDDTITIVTNCIIRSNTASKHGGGMYNGTASYCTFSDNTAHEDGGGMYEGTASYCTFSCNTADEDGGGKNSGSADHCLFTENNADSSGGGMDGEFNGTATECVFSKNTCGSTGGGFAAGEVNRCTFSENIAWTGGGVSSCEINNSVLSGNQAYTGGGMSGGNAVNCTLTDNYATEDGGGAFQGSLKNSVLKANRADDSGGGILACHLANCTLTGNSAAYGGGMCYGDAVNCIIWNNVATLSSNNFYEAELTYCASPEVTNEENHNINQDPLLISPFRISTNSPCIAAGNISETSGSDFDGELWQTPPSIGCDEVVPGSVTGEITLSLSGSTNLAVGTSGNYIIHVTGAITQTILSFSDGDSITNALTSVNHTWNTAGNQSVTFTAFNDDYPTGVSMILPVSVISVAESTICVDGSTGSDSNEGNSWANPKKTIQAGVDAQSIENGWIIVSNGTYAISTAIAVEKPVHIRSLNGLEQTVIEGPGYDLDVLTEDDETAGRCFYLNNNKCILSGLTITGGGVACEEDSSCVVSNCLFIENTAYFGGGMYLGTAINCTFRENTSEAGGGKYGGTAILCTFIDNAAEYSGGGMCEGTANRSLFTGNSAGAGGGMCRGTANSSLFSGNDSMWGGGMYNGTANHCNFIGNRAKQGGGIYNSKVNNCIIWYNEATDEGDNIYAFIYGDHNYYCCSPDLDHGVDGNITNDPLLISAAHISTNSLCIAAGKLLHASPATDYDGESWQSPPAIGCDAVQSGAVAGLINLSIEGPTNTCAGTAASYTPIIHGGVTRTILTFSDGASITNALAPIQHSWTALGSQTISIQAFNDDYPAGLSFILPVQVSSTEAATIYVSELNGSDSNDGSSWATAKQSIQAGVDAQAFYGGQILVTNGTYSVTNEIMITKPIEVISVNGAESTIVDGGNSNRCFNLRNSDCLISGFTITGGYATNDNFHTGSLNGDGGGVYCWGYNPEITECVITENNAASYGGGVYYGRISRSHLSKNTAHNGGALCYSEAESCVIVKNSAIVSDIYVFDHSTGGGVYEGVVVNCTIADNSAEGSGGIYKGEAFNSIIWNNISTNGYSPDFYETYCQSSCSPTLTNNVDGNIYQDPLFISSDNNNYRLPSESPCVDAGANEWVNYSLDFDGGPRIENEAVDMGAFEVNPIYVSDDDGNDSNDGKSWMTAKKTIQAGINAQNILGGIVLVASGTYFPTSTITCSQNVSIIATQGAETTIVNGGGTIPCFNLGETTTLIKGFTITNGVTTGDGLYTGNGGGVYADSFDATLDECIISGNSAVNGGGAHKCTLTRCILRGNTASNDGGALVHSIANNCIIQDNIADYIGGGMYGGTANNCNLINNSAYRSGGIHGGAANNSIIWGNSASNVSNELYNTTTHHSCSPA